MRWKVLFAVDCVIVVVAAVLCLMMLMRMHFEVGYLVFFIHFHRVPNSREVDEIDPTVRL